MKYQARLLLTAIFFVLLAVGLYGCGAKSVEKCYLDYENHIIVKYTDGSTEDFGEGKLNSIGQSSKKVLDRINVDESCHAIAYYTDGSTEDLGYVGVEAPLYTVTFTDAEGNVLETQQVFQGRAATPPEAPAADNSVFDRWDGEIENVQSDMTVKPLYKEAESYTVTFLDEDGTVLSTESVYYGNAAVGPKTPTKSGMIFAGWSGSVSEITQDTTVSATYRKPGNFTVTFYDYNGAKLGTSAVTEGQNAIAPVTPTREGYKFTGWSKSIKAVSSDFYVVAQYSFNGGTNVLDIATDISGSKLTVTVTVKGNVKVCGMEANLTVPAGLTFVSAKDGDGVTSNYSGGKVYMMFSSGSGKNVTSSFTVTTLTFTIGSGASSSVKFATAITDIYDQDFTKVSSSVVGQTVKIK